MSQLSERIKELVDQFPGSFSELARTAGIDRSTLYKITGGKRLPTQRQLQALLDIAHVSPQQRRDLTDLYLACTTDADAQARSAQLQSLLLALLHRPQLPAVPQPAAACSSAALLTAPGEISRCLTDALHRYLADGSALPLMLSPRLPAAAQSCILQTLRSADAPREVWQLAALAPYSSGSGNFYSSLSALRAAIPYLYADGLRYQGHLFYEDVPAGQQSGVLLPHYLLLPDCAFLFDRDGAALYRITDKAAVEHLRLRFTQEFLRTEPYLLLHDEADVPPAEPVAQIGPLPTPDCKALCYFSEAALAAFARSAALPADRRAAMLDTLYRRCADGAPLRMANPTLFPLDADLSLTITAGRQLQIRCRAADGPRCYILRDKDLADALLQYLHQLENAPLLRSRSYTLDFIRCCRNAVR